MPSERPISATVSPRSRNRNTSLILRIDILTPGVAPSRAQRERRCRLMKRKRGFDPTLLPAAASG
jgi:hypothetical protein